VSRRWLLRRDSTVMVHQACLATSLRYCQLTNVGDVRPLLMLRECKPKEAGLGTHFRYHKGSKLDLLLTSTIETHR